MKHAQKQLNAAAAPYVKFATAPGAFQHAKDGAFAKILVDANDWAGVIRAAKGLGDDVGKVAGSIEKGSVVVGTIGKSKLIDSLIADKKNDVSKVKGQWESFLIQTVDGSLVVAGSDKRGMIYGIYDIANNGVLPCRR